MLLQDNCKIMDRWYPTSSIFIDEVRKPPHIADTNGVGQPRHKEVVASRPIATFLIFLLAPYDTPCVNVISCVDT